MNNSRSDTLFSLRYAVRVLERYARMWNLVGAGLKAISILSGTVALAALTGANSRVAVVMGVVFAALQALEYALGPAEKRAEALAERRNYARVLAAEASMNDAALDAAYQRVVADDEIVIIQSLRELAYNDVVREQGKDESHCYADHGFMRAFS